MRGAAAAALALLLAACRHPTRVGAAGGAGETATAGSKDEPTPAQKGVPPRGEHPRVPSSPKALLAEGEIAKIQDALARRGYLAERHEAGMLDDPTTTAIRRFQREQSLAETGFPDRLTLQQLGIDPEDAYSKVKEPKDEGERRRTGEGSAGKGATESPR